ncbi:hypothetical protein M3Y95_00539400 [Aphelenchoides besseyi]|nr:hypothetical protein M3Y95_00539400 [Aphelenchoides besseyi]
MNFGVFSTCFQSVFTATSSLALQINSSLMFCSEIVRPLPEIRGIIKLLDFVDETTFYYTSEVQETKKTAVVKVEFDSLLARQTIRYIDCDLRNGTLSPCGKFFYTIESEIPGRVNCTGYVFRKTDVQTLECTTYKLSEQFPVDWYCFYLPLNPKFRYFSAYNLLLIDEDYATIERNNEHFDVHRTLVYKFEIDELNKVLNLTRLTLPDPPVWFEPGDIRCMWHLDVIDDPPLFFHEHINGAVHTLDYESDEKWKKNKVEGLTKKEWDPLNRDFFYEHQGIIHYLIYDNNHNSQCYRLVFNRQEHTCRRIDLFYSTHVSIVANQDFTSLVALNYSTSPRLFDHFEILSLMPSLRALCCAELNKRKRVYNREPIETTSKQLNGHLIPFVSRSEVNKLINELTQFELISFLIKLLPMTM